MYRRQASYVDRDTVDQTLAHRRMGLVHHSRSSPPMSALGHSRPGPAGRRSNYFRYAPKATVGHQNAIGRDGPIGDITPLFKTGQLA